MQKRYKSFMNIVKLKGIRNSLAINLLLLVFTAITGLQPALADGPLVTGTIDAGLLSETSPAAEAFVGTPGGTSTYTIPIAASDLTGSGSGWNLTITSTTFTSGANTLPTTASTITGVTANCVGTVPLNCSNSTLTNTITSLPTVPAATIVPTAVKFFGTAAGTGKGTYTVTPTISVAIPAATQLGAYLSTVTLAIASGP
jgi:hypothetical protein